MKEVSNKEVIEKLIKYFMKQDKEVICRVAANFMIDMNRMYSFEKLPLHEQVSLTTRFEINIQSLGKFISSNDESDLTFIKW